MWLVETFGHSSCEKCLMGSVLAKAINVCRQADIANLDYRPDTAAEEETCAHAFRSAFYSLTTLLDCHHKETVHDTDCVSELKKPDSGLVCIRGNEYTKSFAHHTNATCQKGKDILSKRITGRHALSRTNIFNGHRSWGYLR